MTNQPNIDGVGDSGQAWYYSDIVKDHFFNPRNFMKMGEEEEFKADGMGRVGSPACGDEMVLWVKIDPKEDKIKECRWRTFGCGSAIASTSILSVMLTENGGMKLDEALKLRPQDIMERLGGLPSRKVHCSVLGDKALRSALNDYFHKSGQHQRVIVEGSRVIDEELKITDHDIEQAVLDGAVTLEDVQKKLKVGIGNPETIPAIEDLIRFYKEKYFGV
ncbi:MAG: iron-sulfur cluster assembly scaffold protein [Candidatus Magasanikbacteria bacterium]|nr:iron-sulfur cluster assembly scaffold protein [Candidatus Magasanikbacteria bacterium]